MGAFLMALLPLLGGLTQPIKDYFASKAEQAKLTQQLELARLEANKEAIVSGNEADTEQRKNYLNSVSSSFRQGIFYWFSAIIAYSIIFPSRAQEMWHNFSLIPEWVQYAYLGMVCVAWGLPVAKENIGLMFASIGRGIANQREYKLAKLNRKAVFDGLKQMFPKGMNQAQVNVIDQALDAGEQS